MTIIFHTPYPNTRAQLTFLGVTTDLTTSAEGDLYQLEAPDGTHPFTLFLINGQYWTGNVTVTNNNGYIDVTPVPQPAPNNMLVIGGVLAVALALGVAYWKHWI